MTRGEAIRLDSLSDARLFILASKHLDPGDLGQRRQLLTDLRCHSFRWFLDNVYKDAPFPNGDLYLGQVSGSARV